jgi:hypothetical protein
MKITDFCIIKTPRRNCVEVYRITDVNTGTYHKYDNPTISSINRVLRYAPPANQRMTRITEEDGWQHEKTWACDRPRYAKQYHPLQGKLYIDISFR